MTSVDWDVGNLLAARAVLHRAGPSMRVSCSKVIQSSTRLRCKVHPVASPPTCEDGYTSADWIVAVVVTGFIGSFSCHFRCCCCCCFFSLSTTNLIVMLFPPKMLLMSLKASDVRSRGPFGLLETSLMSVKVILCLCVCV